MQMIRPVSRTAPFLSELTREEEGERKEKEMKKMQLHQLSFQQKPISDTVGRCQLQLLFTRCAIAKIIANFMPNEWERKRGV